MQYTSNQYQYQYQCLVIEIQLLHSLYKMMNGYKFFYKKPWDNLSLFRINWKKR